MVLVEWGVGFETHVFEQLKRASPSLRKALAEANMESKPPPPSSLSRDENGEASRMSRVTSDFAAEVAQVISTTEGRSGARWSRSSALSSSPLDLHRRCRETIERCAARLRERQRKMERLQVALPTSKTTRTTRQRPVCQDAAPPSRSTPPRPAKRNKLSIFDRKENSAGASPPTWSPSSISMVGSRHSLHTTPISRFNEMTTSPFFNRKSTMQTRTKYATGPSISNSSSPTPNQETKQQGKHENTQSSEGAHQFSSTNESSGPEAIPSMTSSPTWSQRQQSFMEAIEAEAHSNASSLTEA